MIVDMTARALRPVRRVLFEQRADGLQLVRLLEDLRPEALVGHMVMAVFADAAGGRLLGHTLHRATRPGATRGRSRAAEGAAGRARSCQETFFGPNRT